jgi:hypothetical protein
MREMVIHLRGDAITHAFIEYSLSVHHVLTARSLHGEEVDQ